MLYDANTRAIDPKYEEEVSGCTACVSLIADNKLYVVRKFQSICMDWMTHNTNGALFI
jgi:hypothetical protein